MSARTGIVHQPRGQAAVEFLSLEEVRVNAWVVDVSSRVVLAQTFYNPRDEPTGRAKYIFPLPANAAVCAFELESDDGSFIVGEVKEKEEAALAFSRAAEQGKVAALVESVTDDIFSISVGSIPATARVIARLTFVMDLLNGALRDHVRLQLPMYITERYGVPPAAMDDTSAADSRTRLRIAVDVQTSDVIRGIRSPTHNVVLRRFKGRSDQASQRRMSAIWESPEFLNSDFVITIHAEGLDKPRCFAEVIHPRVDGNRQGSTVAMQLTLVPKFLVPKIPSQEYIFVIDRSYSMSNEPIQTAKKTLVMLLRLLPSTQTTFNIFGFGSTVDSMWERSRQLDPVSLHEAIKYVEHMDANYPGTEIPNALNAAFNSRGLDRPAVLFLLTDGQIYGGETLDPWAVVSNAIHNSPPHAPVRLFVLGIGTGVSSDICSSLARTGNGEYLFALRAEDIFGKCARLLNAGSSKTIERVTIDWGHGASSIASVDLSPIPALPAGIPTLGPPPSVQQAPHTLTEIFSGMRFVVFAITTFMTIPTSVRLIVKVDGFSKPQEFVANVTKVKPFRDTNAHSPVPIVHTLAARRLIMDLNDGVGPLPTPAAGDALLVSKDELQKAGIVRLGLTYQLVSKHTSFVAVQEGDQRRRRSGRASAGWVRSRLLRTVPDAQEDSRTTEPPQPPTFLDGMIDGVSNFLTSVFGLFSNPATTSTNNSATGGSTLRTRARSPRRQFPGGFGESNSSTDYSESEGGRGRVRARPRSRSPVRRRVSTRRSSDTFSSLSSLDGTSSCSSCWTTTSRSSSHAPLPERAPSPEVRRGDTVGPSGSGPGAGAGTGGSDQQQGASVIPPEVFALFQEMDADGSVKPQRCAQLVGDWDVVLRRGREVLGCTDETVWATIVAVAYVRTRLRGAPDVAELMAEKAEAFVGASEWAGTGTGAGRGFEELVWEAEKLLSGVH